MPLEPFDFGKYQEDQEMRDTLPYSDPLHPRGFFRDRQIGGWELWWGGYQYWIEDDRMKDERDLLRWLEHLGRKDWPGMTTPRAARFITAVLDHLGKPLYPS